MRHSYGSCNVVYDVVYTDIQCRIIAHALLNVQHCVINVKYLKLDIENLEFDIKENIC